MSSARRQARQGPEEQVQEGYAACSSSAYTAPHSASMLVDLDCKKEKHDSVCRSPHFVSMAMSATSVLECPTRGPYRYSRCKESSKKPGVQSHTPFVIHHLLPECKHNHAVETEGTRDLALPSNEGSGGGTSRPSNPWVPSNPATRCMIGGNPPTMGGPNHPPTNRGEPQLCFWSFHDVRVHCQRDAWVFPGDQDHVTPCSVTTPMNVFWGEHTYGRGKMSFGVC